MREFEYLIVGGGLAAAAAVEGIRECDPHGSIGLLTEEAEPPYQRPPLSKEYLQTPGMTRELLYVKPEGWFETEAGATLFTEHRVESLDAKRLTVVTEAGGVFGGARLLLATGGRPRTLTIPGVELPGVLTLRTVDDSEALKAAATEAKTALLIGAGFIGMELAASLIKFDVDSIVVEQDDRVWSRLLPSEISGFMQRYFEERNVEFRLSSRVAALQGDGKVELAVLEHGEEVLCDLAVVGVGLTPNDELARAAGMAVDDGVIVDAFGETSHAYVYAAGDVARYPDPVFGEPTRVEHWDHAREHGKVVGRNMAGDQTAYDHLSYFFSTVFDLGLNAFGRPADADEILVEGELGEEPSVVYCSSGGQLCGAILVNSPRRMPACRDLVRQRPSMDEVARLVGTTRATAGMT
jgi:3-phenylpropionate/trans-cinnamate dioxygenase ferredoxin reductase subunit